jgi:hypothetical protein
MNRFLGLLAIAGVALIAYQAFKKKGTKPAKLTKQEKE